MPHASDPQYKENQPHTANSGDHTRWNAQPHTSAVTMQNPHELILQLDEQGASSSCRRLLSSCLIAI